MPKVLLSGLSKVCYSHGHPGPGLDFSSLQVQCVGGSKGRPKT